MQEHEVKDLTVDICDMVVDGSFEQSDFGEFVDYANVLHYCSFVLILMNGLPNHYQYSIFDAVERIQHNAIHKFSGLEVVYIKDFVMDILEKLFNIHYVFKHVNLNIC